MSTFLGFIIVLFAGLISWYLTRVIRIYAKSIKFIEYPNHRSSHNTPTARGGGLAIAVASLLGFIVISTLIGQDFWAILVLSTLMALLGLIDDLYGLSPFLRFPIQIVLIASLVITIDPLPPFNLLLELKLEWLVLICVLISAGVWWVNLYNFMDGIDGIAASQTIIILMVSLLFGWQQNDIAAFASLRWMTLVLVATTAGFLIMNWPPASIFMGDVGSNFIAVVMFGIALISVKFGCHSYAEWVILTGVFVSDATVTVMRRIVRGERPWLAHRRHGYQQAARLWGHRNVTIGYCIATVLWAAPLAYASRICSEYQWIIMAVCYFPLFMIAVGLGSGSAHERGLEQ